MVYGRRDYLQYACAEEKNAQSPNRIDADVEDAREELRSQIAMRIGDDLSIDEIRALLTQSSLGSLQFEINKVLHKVAKWNLPHA